MAISILANLRICLRLLVIVFAAFAAGAQTDSVAAAPRSAEFTAAAKEFTQLDPDQRVKLQIMLTAAGYWQAVPNQDFSIRLFEAIKRFQLNNELAQDGKFKFEDISRLSEMAGPILDRWDFRVYAHPQVGGSIWVPYGLGLQRNDTQNGVEFTDKDNMIKLVFEFFPNITISTAFESASQVFSEKGFGVVYSKIYKDEFYAMSIGSAKIDGYLRYQKFHEGILGFGLFWKHDGDPFHTDRMATIISASIWSALSGARFTSPFLVRNQIASAFGAPENKATQSQQASTVVEVPLERTGGVFTVPVIINNAIKLNFVIDSGAADVAIPADVFITISRTGTLRYDDFIGKGSYTLADGSKTNEERFRIRSLKVGGIEINNVVGSAGAVSGSLLLGQSFLQRFKSWSIDNDKGVLRLTTINGSFETQPGPLSPSALLANRQPGSASSQTSAPPTPHALAENPQTEATPSPVQALPTPLATPSSASIPGPVPTASVAVAPPAVPPATTPSAARQSR